MKEHTYDEVLGILKDALNEDFDFEGGRVLGSMCTRPLDIAKVAHGMFIEANLGNPGLYPGSKKLERELVGMQADLLHGTNVTGHVGGGGTESNITALWIARNRSGKREVVFPKTAHFSIIKACDLLGMKPVMVEVDDGYTMDLDDASGKIGKDTAAVVAIAGTTELGLIDPVKALGELCADVFLHVDAAFGGYVIPFLRDLGHQMPDFDFSVPNVSSVSIDAHKMGMASIPSGTILLRDEKQLESITFKSPYLTREEQQSISGTRCSAGAVSAYAAMKLLGREGYVKIVKDCMDVTEHAMKRAGKMGIEPVIKPVMNILNLKTGKTADVYNALDELGWKTSMSRIPSALRLVIMPHVTKEIIDEFMDDLEKVCRKLGVP
jgi:tyrosine decarboxylase/aspartate 1-decarboxylase